MPRPLLPDKRRARNKLASRMREHAGSRPSSYASRYECAPARVAATRVVAIVPINGACIEVGWGANRLAEMQK